MKILFSGGGTLGPVTPLLAFAEQIRSFEKDAHFIWVGTKDGPEKDLVVDNGIVFLNIESAKFRRYFSIFNLLDFLKLGVAFLQSVYILWRDKPDICISAGGFVSVPIHMAAWLMGVPTWIHQQDIEVGLANRIMSKHATIITTATADEVESFKHDHVFWIGNPVRAEILNGNAEKAKEIFDISSELPVVFATGGGTGSARVNQLVAEMVPHLKNIAEIIHLTGKERPKELAEKASQFFDYYHHYAFFNEEMKHAYALSDLVISRAGFGTMTELAALRKPAILIPKPGHQEKNANYFSEKGAVLILDENIATGYELAMKVKEILEDKQKSAQMAEKIDNVLPRASTDDTKKMLALALKLANE